MAFIKIIDDARAIQRNDPANRSIWLNILCHTPLWAIAAYRLGHLLHRWGLGTIGRLIATSAKITTGIEIHPAARIGRGFAIPCGQGTFIGETTEIGENCVLFNNVTLGGMGRHRLKRHPTLGDSVRVDPGAVLLGPITVGNSAHIGANSAVIMHDVPPGTAVIGVPARITRRDGRHVDEPLPRTEERLRDEIAGAS